MPYIFRRPLILLTLLTALTIVVLRFWTGEPSPHPADPYWYALGREMTLSGTVAGDPESLDGKTRFLLRALFLNDRPVRGLVLTEVEGFPVSIGWGDRVQLRGFMTRFKETSVPGEFEQDVFYANQRIHSRLIVPAGGYRVLSRAPWYSLFRAAGSLRRRFRDCFTRHLSPHGAALMSGLWLGEKPRSFPDLQEDFRAGGAYHLLVASGSNVGFVLLAWGILGKWLLGFSKRLTLMTALPFVALYALVAGADPPILRAAWMTGFIIVGYCLSREDRLEHPLALSALLLLLARPSILFEAGFQMSYAATFGILMGVPFLTDRFRRDREHEEMERHGTAKRIFLRAGDWFMGLFFVSLTAQLAMTPFLIHYFHRWNWVGMFSNLLAVPWSGLCLGSGCFLFAIDSACRTVCPSAIPFIAGLTERLLMGLWHVVRFFADIPRADLAVFWSGTQVLILVIGLGALALMAFSDRKKVMGWSAAVLVLSVFGVSVLPAVPFERETLRVTWIDVGLGDAIVVRSPDGKTTLVDAGLFSAGGHRVVPFLRSIGVRELDRIVLTHGDANHSDGLIPVSRQYAVKEFITSPQTWSDPLWSPVRDLLEQEGLRRRLIEAGEGWQDGEVRWECLSPASGDGGDPDETSMVFKIRYKDVELLLTSDVPEQVQRRLVRPSDCRVQVVQVPSHGVSLPWMDFLEDKQPQWFVLSSDGIPGWVSSLSLGPPFWSTSDHGTIQFESDGHTSHMSIVKPRRVPVYRVI
ncbi:MAG TPA: ComEC/Rec2 family competence protein [Elusimicrobiota bacterium]|nr:ComEC/Rec2 family competence protein [Elusimicrobiota bacterium]